MPMLPNLTDGTTPEDPPASRLLSRRVIGKDAATGATLIAYRASIEFTNRHGTVQGEFLAAMLDSAAAMTLLSELPPGRTAVTTRLEVDFLKPASPGELTASAAVASMDERRARVVADLRSSDDVILARANVELRIVSTRGP
jgi:uncharacterized protein (TIGR00369 family)